MGGVGGGVAHEGENGGSGGGGGGGGGASTKEAKKIQVKAPASSEHDS